MHLVRGRRAAEAAAIQGLFVGRDGAVGAWSSSVLSLAEGEEAEGCYDYQEGEADAEAYAEADLRAAGQTGRLGDAFVGRERAVRRRVGCRRSIVVGRRGRCLSAVVAR
ncbi:hypothetical protein Tdes44962_MAKER09663 [Teratosphaeria destructans]|uniref:Uncharacterized protein n=1 Tax=Teratosphaeria destructans TaxID=418781 RepID=A0A9W7SSC8_9PEZI|nr:hypothetical protein Tdes44962_MAKER09663 [Teratosphaeria destructans]